MMTKKYILKPGKHQFAPCSAAVHNNENLSDEEVVWYLQKYPHIASLFINQPHQEGESKTREEKMKNQKDQSINNQTQTEASSLHLESKEGL